MMLHSPVFNPGNQIGDVVSADFRTSAVFRSYKIDFCCGGRKTIHDVCLDKNIDESQLLSEINAVASAMRRRPDPSEWPIPFLIEYIEQTHHRYVRHVLPEIRLLAAKVATVHGEKHPELVAINDLVSELQSELYAHMDDEEKRVFKAIAAAENEENLLPMLDDLETEHSRAGALMNEIERLSDGFIPPQGACRSYQTLFQFLSEFQEDLHEHVHLENNVLFPACRVRRH